MFASTSKRLHAGVLLAGLLLLALGCGPDYKARSVVKGKVSVGKKLLTTGTVMFINDRGVSGSATITPQGEYNLPDAPLGECVVTVTVGKLPDDPSVRARLTGKSKGPKMPGAAMKAPDGTEFGPDLPSGPTVPKEVVPIDEKYSKPDTSGLKFKVEKGEPQTYDIEL